MTDESNTKKTFRSIRNAFGNKDEMKDEESVPKGMHRMPSGELMHDSEMPEKSEAKKSALESMLRGGSQGMTFGLQDKGSALIESGLASGIDTTKMLMDKLGLRKRTSADEAISDIYKDKTLGSLEAEYEQQNKEAEEANPKSFLAGELAADLLLGAAGAGVVSKAAKGIKALKGAKKAASVAKNADEVPTVVARNIDDLAKKIPVKDRRQITRATEKSTKKLDDLGHQRSPNTGEHHTMMDPKKGKKYQWASEKSLEQLNPAEGRHFKNMAAAMKKYGIKDPSELKQLERADREKVIQEVMDLIRQGGE